MKVIIVGASPTSNSFSTLLFELLLQSKTIFRLWMG